MSEKELQKEEFSLEDILKEFSSAADSQPEEDVRICKYDLSFPKAKKKYELVRARKEVYINGVRFEAEINGPFMMIDHKKNLKREEILKAFRSFR